MGSCFISTGQYLILVKYVRKVVFSQTQVDSGMFVSEMKVVPAGQDGVQR